MAIENGKQLKVVIPQHLTDKLEYDAHQVGVPVASMIRMIIAGHYELLAHQQPQPRRAPAAVR